VKKYLINRHIKKPIDKCLIKRLKSLEFQITKMKWNLTIKDDERTRANTIFYNQFRLPSWASNAKHHTCRQGTNELLECCAASRCLWSCISCNENSSVVHVDTQRWHFSVPGEHEVAGLSFVTLGCLATELCTCAPSSRILPWIWWSWWMISGEPMALVLDI
jgi:hypothetical protein